MDMDLTMQELLHITLTHPQTKTTLESYPININKYIDIINKHNIGSNITISTYNEYIIAMPKLLPVFRQYITESEYQMLLFFKNRIDILVSYTFIDLI